MNNNLIQYIRFEDIDTDKWDGCIAKSNNALIYAQSWYLDKVCERWDALVYGDYQYVMPISFKKKFSINYLFQPLFCQQLGIFPTPTKEIMKELLLKAQEHYPFAEIHLNAMNLPIRGVEGSFIPRKNFLLQLQPSYRQLASAYSKHTKRKLKKAANQNLALIRGISVKEYLEFKQQNQKIHINKNNFIRLRNILTFALTKSMGQIYGVYTAQNELCAAAFFLRYKNRVTYLNAASSELGRQQNAMFYLIDQFIHEHASSEFTLDFEGSTVSGVARLYEGFGASPEVYHHLRWNKLPFWLKWLKKS